MIEKLRRFQPQVIAFGLVSLFWVNEVLAYTLPRVKYTPGATVGSPGSPQGVVTAVSSLIQKVADGIASVAAVVAVLFIVINGGRMIFSFGEQEALTKAKKGLLWSLAGLVLIIFSYIIVKSIIALTYSGIS